MKLLVTKNEYKQTNANMDVSADLKTVKAWSWDWWMFVATDDHGNIVFNNAGYSSSTSGHQRDVRDILRRLNIKIGLYLHETTCNLDKICVAVQDEIRILCRKIEELDKLTKTKGTHRRKNDERRAQIKRLEYRIKDLKAYLEHGRLPSCKISNTDFNHWWVWEQDRYLDPEWEQEEQVRQHERQKGFERYFLKPNGTVKRNELKVFMENLQGYHNAPDNIENLRQFLGLKADGIIPLLAYQYAQDLNHQIPAEGTNEELKLRRFVEKHNVCGVNTLLLDKMHTFLTNMENRKTYDPREPEPLPLNPVIERLKGRIEELTVIDNVQKLRSEGRRQSHCIGGQNYIQMCKRGYQALNYKGYTFFLEPSLEIRETKGKYNDTTPANIVREFKALLAQ